MKLRSRGMLRCAAPLAALLVLSGCSEGNRPIPYSEVQVLDIPEADVDNQQNTNITNPTLEIPETSPVLDGDPLTLVWRDEFDGSTLNPETWFFESGDGTQYGIPQPSFGNNELQWYLPDNSQVSGGTLKITAQRENAEGYSVTSGRIMTRDRFAFTYGRIEASIKLPPGQGIWPAFWMLSQDDEPNAVPGFGTYGGYARSGEIDIVEAVNLKGTPGPGGVGGGNEIFSTIHFGGTFEEGSKTQSETRFTPGVDVTADFNTYAFEWDPFEMRWYFNGILFKVENSWFSTGGPFPAPFDKPFYVLFNLAVGGNFPGPLGADALPATMEVDWVRVYSGATPPPPDFDSGLLTNGDFEAGRPFWLSGLSAPIGFENLVADPDNADNTVYFVNVTGANPEQPFLVNLSQKVAITPNEIYKLSFRARSDRDRTLIAGIGLSGGDFSNTTETVGLTTTWQDFSVELTATGFGDENSRVLFDMNGENGQVYIDNVRLEVLVVDPGLIPDDVIYATDPNEMVDLDTTVTPFGTSSQFNGNAQDRDFNPSFEARSGSGYGLDNIVQLGFVGLPAGFATDYESFLFKIKSNDLPGNTIVVKLEQGGQYGEVLLTDTNVSTPLGNGWYQVVLPMADFTNVAPAVGVLFERVGPQNGDGGMPFSMLVTDIGFNNPPPGSTPPATGTELIVNGDFETGSLDPWANFGATAATVTDTDPADGTYAMSFDGGPSDNIFARQSGLAAGTIANGDTVTVTLDMKGSVTESSITLQILELGAPFQTITNLTADYQSFTFDVNIDADVPGGISFQIGSACGPSATCDISVFIDNVSVTLNDGGG